MSAKRSLRQNWAVPASVCLHAAVIAGFLLQFAKAAPSLPADAEVPSLAVEVMLLPTEAPAEINTSPPPPPPPPPEPEVVEEPPPIVQSVAEEATAEPPPPPPKVKRKPDPKPVVKQPVPPEPVMSQAPSEPTTIIAPPAAQVPAPRAEQMALAAPAGRAGPPPDYVSALLSHIKRQHHMPRGIFRKAQYVTAMVEISIDRQGRLLNYRIERPTGVAVFDDEIPALMKRIDPMPPPPPEITVAQYTFVVPIEFIVR